MPYDAPANDTIKRARRSIAIAIAGFATVMQFGMIGYKAMGGDAVSWLDALYMTFLMVATIGYGAGIEVFHHPYIEVFTMVISFSGIAVVTYFFSAVTSLVLASDFDKTMRRRRMDKTIKKLHGHYIICGFGRVGHNVADELTATHREFIAIDEKEPELDAFIEKNPGLIYLHGDASDDDLMNEANIAGAKGVFAVTGDDSRNLMISLTARQLAPQIRVVARCNDIRNSEKMRKAGADAIVSPNFTGGMRIASAMIRPHVVSFLDEMLRSERHLRVEEIPIPSDFSTCALSELNLKRSDDYLLLAVRTGEQWVFNPHPDQQLKAGNTIVAMASPKGRLELETAVAG